MKKSIAWIILAIFILSIGLTKVHSEEIKVSHPGGSLDLLLHGPVVATPAKPKATVVIQQPSIPLRGNHWTHPDTIRNHLMQSHGYSASQLQGLTNQQMLSLHDADHEGHRISLKPRTIITTQSSGCPGGNCPIPNRRR